ncbi:MAG: DUF2344 domain-containing protein [Chloroflexi bacterium]|nr:DUF2344 domain-containing protein [Chloroflexota bacterium]
MDTSNGVDDRGAKAQRLRIVYGRGKEAADIGQLDFTRIWEQALKDAGVELSYSRGNRPQPRLTMAAGLPMGVTADGELLDAITSKVCSTQHLLKALVSTLPNGICAIHVQEVGMGLPSLPVAVRWADYEVDVVGADEQAVDAAVSKLLAAEAFPWEDARGEKIRHYDLRPLVADISIHEACGDVLRLRMRLRCATDGVGRAEQVTKALGLSEPARIHRRRLLLAEESPARTAWRRRGRYL